MPGHAPPGSLPEGAASGSAAASSGGGWVLGGGGQDCGSWFLIDSRCLLTAAGPPAAQKENMAGSEYLEDQNGSPTDSIT